MPGPSDRSRSMWLGLGDAWSMVGTLLTATCVWAAIGYGLDRVLGTWPFLFAIGAVVGHSAGIYILWRKVTGKGTAPVGRGRRRQA